jgi:hypothetical protein
MITGLFSGTLHIGSGILSLFIGVGLLRHVSLCRKVAMVMLAAGLLLTLILGGVAIVSNAIPVMWFDQKLFGVERNMAAIGVSVTLLLAYSAMFLTLRRADVKAMFEDSVASPITDHNEAQIAI